MTTELKPFTTTIHCIHRGCAMTGKLLVHPSSSPNVHGITPPDGWHFYALGFPKAIDLGLCPEHHAFAVGDLNVTVTREDHRGLVFTIADGHGSIGSVCFPTNTLEVTFPPGPVSMRQRVAGLQVAAAIDFRRPAV